MVFTPFNVLFFSNLDFSGTAYCRDSKPESLDSAHLEPYIHATQSIWMHFSQSKSTKCEKFHWWLNSLNKKFKKKCQFYQGKSVWKVLNICKLQCTMLELCVTSTSWVMMFFSWNLDLWGSAYHRHSKAAPLDSAHLKPYICTTEAISMHFPSQNQQNVNFVAVCLTPPDKKYKMSILTGKKCLKSLEYLHI